ncbi:VOC family protein [Polymorphobacter arshaanensis]|uniref:Bleomycin resistance protein n=2 Tax=Glacieibacterium arshaanense TaxID=2511025 RepID=A0A4Y9ETX4_9SPHN|nr:VOC family protein [Polymorphobacter arshaanensis]
MRNSQRWATLVPELTVSNLETSLAFYCNLIGCSVRFTRLNFAYLELGAAELMLDATSEDWATAERRYPSGRGINLQIEVADVTAIRDRLVAAQVALFRPLEDCAYVQATAIHRQRQFLVQDPDGYLLRFCQPLPSLA